MSTTELATQLDEVEPEASSSPGQGHRFTAETAKQAAKRSADSRAQRRAAAQAPPSDEAIERGLRQRAVSSAKDAEVLLRWLSRPRLEPSTLGLDRYSEEQLEGLYKRILALCSLDDEQLASLLSS